MIKTNCPWKMRVCASFAISVSGMLRLERIFGSSCSWPWAGDAPEGQCSLPQHLMSRRDVSGQMWSSCTTGHSERTYRTWLASEGFHKVSPWRVPRKSTGKERKRKQSPHYLLFYSVSSPKLLQPQCDIQDPRPNEKFIGGFLGKKERERVR